MANYDNRPTYGAAVGRGAVDVVDQGLRAHMLRVYNYMTIGLVVTGAVAWAVVNTSLINLFYTVGPNGAVGMSALGWIALFAPLGLVFLLSAGISRMSVGTAQAVFWIYAALMGVSLAPILLIYTGASIAKVFFISAATFGALSLWGYTTSRGPDAVRVVPVHGLIGVIIASVVNIFLASSAVSFAISASNPNRYQSGSLKPKSTSSASCSTERVNTTADTTSPTANSKQETKAPRPWPSCSASTSPSSPSSTNPKSSTPEP